MHHVQLHWKARPLELQNVRVLASTMQVVGGYVVIQRRHPLPTNQRHLASAAPSSGPSSGGAIYLRRKALKGWNHTNEVRATYHSCIKAQVG